MTALRIANYLSKIRPVTDSFFKVRWEKRKKRKVRLAVRRDRMLTHTVKNPEGHRSLFSPSLKLKKRKLKPHVITPIIKKTKLSSNYPSFVNQEQLSLCILPNRNHPAG